MKQLYSNFLTMVKAVIASLVKDQQAWSSEPEIVTEMASVQSDYQTAETLAVDLSGKNPKSYTTATNESYEQMLVLCIQLCHRMRVYAHRLNDSIVLSFFKYNRYTIIKGSRTEVVDRCTAMINEAQKILPQVANFKVDQAFLDSIRLTISDYGTKTDAHSNLVQDKKVKNQQSLPDVVHSIRQHLTVLDDLVEGFIDDQDVIFRYKQARLTVNYGKGKTLKNPPKKTDVTPVTPSK